MDKFFLTKEQFQTYRTKYLARAHAKTTTSEDIVLYNIIRGKSPRSGFTPITNPNKLNCCALDPWNGFNEVKSDLLVLTREQSPMPNYLVSRRARFCEWYALDNSPETFEFIRKAIIS